LVVVDASPLIGLAIVDGLKWLPELFGTVFMPELVKNEVLPGVGAIGEESITHCILSGCLKIWPEPIPSLSDIDLDSGETDCINLCLSYADKSLLIMDERMGRAVAKEKGLTVVGTAAMIDMAKKQGLIPSARKAFEVLHKSDFRISAAIINQVLLSLNEQP
jgi:predicted nucleic acid-binding protein